MSANSFGDFFTVTSFGESHGLALGVVIDGVPAGLPISKNDIQKDLDRRKPGQSSFTTARKETDQVEFLAGISTDGCTNGAPLAFLIRNQDKRSQDYDNTAFRPGHADWPYFIKYNLSPQAGGGRASGRETVARVAAGAVARKILKALNVNVFSFTTAIGKIKAQEINPIFAETDPLRFADPKLTLEAQKEVLKAKNNYDSLGGVVEIRAENVPQGLGEPIFAKLEAKLGAALFSIGAVKGVEFGDALFLAQSLGSEANDSLGANCPLSNHHSGILAGISTGLPIGIRIYLKPTPSIGKKQKSINTKMEEIEISTQGRHDPCLAPRIGPVAEAMVLLTLMDAYLAQRARFELIKELGLQTNDKK